MEEDRRVSQNSQNLEGENKDLNSSKKPRVRDLFVWRSMNRTRWQYGKEVFATFGAIAFLVTVLLVLFQEWLAIGVVWAALFLFWQLTKMPPEEVEHKITTEGIISMNHAYLWIELGPFWFSERGGEHFLHISHRNVIGQLIILVDKGEVEKIKETLAEYLPFIEVPEKSTVDRMSDWFAKKFPLRSSS